MKTRFAYSRRGSKKTRQTRSGCRRFVPALEVLEERTLLSSHIHEGDLIAVTPCTTETAPEISAVEVSTPVPWEILSHGSIHYVTGSAVDVALTMPSCMAVTDILAGDFSLVEAERNNDGIEQTSNLYDLLSDEALPDGHRVTYRLYFSNAHDGSSSEYRFQVQNSLRRLATNDSTTDFRDLLVPTAEHEFTLVEVLEVSAGAVPSVSMSEAELRNRFILGIFNNYGDQGRYEQLGDEGNVAHVTYDPSYDDLELQITPSGIRFGYSVKYSLDDYCDPKARVEGEFQLMYADGQLWPAFSEGPSVVDLDFSDEDVEELYCDVPAAIADAVIGGLTLTYFNLVSVVTRLAEDQLKQEIQEQINTFVDSSAFIADGWLELYEDELRVPLDLYLPGVTIQVPYNIDRIEQPYGAGLALNAGDAVLVTSQGVVGVGRENNGIPPTDTVPIGSQGLFNIDRNVPEPIADYYFTTSDGQVILIPERLEALQALTTLERSYTYLGDKYPATLPLSGDNVGALVGRLAYGFDVAGPRQLISLGELFSVPDTAPARLAFGRNDIGPAIGKDVFSVTSGTYGSGSHHVSISWLSAGTAKTRLNYVTGELTAVLGDDNDEVGIAGTDNGFDVTINGVTSFYPVGAVSAITVQTGGGDDVITLQNIAATLPVHVNGGDGTDTVLRDPSAPNWFVAEGLEIGCAPSVFTVTTTADGGPGSLRQAILDANINCGRDTIAFDISGAGVHTIQPLSALPTITDPVVIDAYTQPGATPNSLAEGNDAVLRIELDGSLAGAGVNGLHVTAGANTVRGLVLNRFSGSGILLRRQRHCRQLHRHRRERQRRPGQRHRRHPH